MVGTYNLRMPYTAANHYRTESIGVKSAPISGHQLRWKTMPHPTRAGRTAANTPPFLRLRASRKTVGRSVDTPPLPLLPPVQIRGGYVATCGCVGGRVVDNGDMNWVFLLSLPLVSALIGWATNRLAIQMLFRPRRPVRLCGIRWQGLIPRRHEEIAHSVGEIVETQLLNQHVLQAEVARIDLQPYVDEYVARLIHARVGPKLRAIPVFGHVAATRVLPQIEQMAREEMRRESEALLRRFASDAESHLPVRRIVVERIRAFDLDRLESIIHRLAGREFRQIEVLGGALGLAIGLAQVALFLVFGSQG